MRSASESIDGAIFADAMSGLLPPPPAGGCCSVRCFLPRRLVVVALCVASSPDWSSS
jgi:hypothetical protein